MQRARPASSGLEGGEGKIESNKVANELAALARRNAHSAVWLGWAPAGHQSH